jgi:hypothetical protein
MDVSVCVTSDSAIRGKPDALEDLEQAVHTHFIDRAYGPDVNHLTVGVHIFPPDDTGMHGARPLKFMKTLKVPVAKKVLTNVVEYYIFPDYERVKRSSQEKGRAYVAQMLIDSTDILIKNQAKYPDWDAARFRADFTAFLRKYLPTAS